VESDHHAYLLPDSRSLAHGKDPRLGEPYTLTHDPCSTIRTPAITSVALSSASLDELVVATVLPVIRRRLHASISRLEWRVNAYALTFAVRPWWATRPATASGGRRTFAIGPLLLGGASATPALSTSANALDLARVSQGVGGAIVTPFTPVDSLRGGRGGRGEPARARTRHPGRHPRLRDGARARARQG
jgi:hypothetical protein